MNIVSVVSAVTTFSDFDRSAVTRIRLERVHYSDNDCLWQAVVRLYSRAVSSAVAPATVPGSGGRVGTRAIAGTAPVGCTTVAV